MFKNIETKVVAAGAGGAIGAALGTFLLWLIGVFIAHVPADAAHETAAKAAVPTAVSDLLVALITLGAALLAGYKAPHTFRQDLADLNTALQVAGEVANTSSTPAAAAPVASSHPLPTDPQEPDAATQALQAATASVPLAPAPGLISPAPSA